MPEYTPLLEYYDSFVDSGTPPFRHASQAPVHEADPSCVANDPDPSPPQTLPPSCPSVSGSFVPQHHAVGPHKPVGRYVSPYPGPALTPPEDPVSTHSLASLQSSLQNGEPVDSSRHLYALSPSQQPSFPPESQVHGSQGNPTSYGGLLSPPSSPEQPPAQQTGPLCCSGCNRTYVSKFTFDRHIRESTTCPYGQGGRRFTCYWCASQVAGRRSTLKQHLMEVHGKGKQEAEDDVNVWYNRYGVENEHPGAAAMLEIAMMQCMMQCMMQGGRE